LLVVDDNLESRLLLRQLLEPVGFKVVEAAGGREAIDLCRKDPPDLVWMDIRMAEMDGYEAARRIRETESAKRNEDGTKIHTPIIAFTAGVMENKEASPHAGVFNDWVYKPFREEEIFVKLEKHLGVRFVSEPAGFRAAQEDSPKDREPLTPADLSDLPPDWLEEFSHLVKAGRSRQLLVLIDRVCPTHPRVSRILGELVRAHDYERLIALFGESREEKASG
jgi:CheY-like chemotaxis protein